MQSGFFLTENSSDKTFPTCSLDIPRNFVFLFPSVVSLLCLKLCRAECGPLSFGRTLVRAPCLPL